MLGNSCASNKRDLPGTEILHNPLPLALGGILQGLFQGSLPDPFHALPLLLYSASMTPVSAEHFMWVPRPAAPATVLRMVSLSVSHQTRGSRVWYKVSRTGRNQSRA